MFSIWAIETCVEDKRPCPRTLSTLKALRKALSEPSTMPFTTSNFWNVLKSVVDEQFPLVWHDLKSMCLLANIHFCVGADDRNLAFVAQQIQLWIDSGPQETPPSSWPSILTASAIWSSFPLHDPGPLLCPPLVYAAQRRHGPWQSHMCHTTQNVSAISTFKQSKINNDCTASWARSFE